ncbi:MULTISPECIES: amidohydrolase [Exiguobacterium]|uniref:amidohydrolase n=1 Tax=Exiguobacterium TaxID=33986 RepID=UPI0018A7A213|nr:MULTISPECIES: amidohydrolase [Exiguobacterium]MBF8154219.1 amidohydrolase [Exiguobacterium sp. TBG-PICH-001]QZY87450.1 amidohydrolase [Exiguobacterium acetylicum]
MDILIRNAHIYPITSDSFYGDIRIRDGKIIEIGELLDHLEDDQVIEAEGHFLLPGFIDAHTHLGLYDEGTGTVGNDANETIFAMTPHLRAIDGVYPLDEGFKEAVEHGITTVQVMPGSMNIIGGVTSVIKTHGRFIDDMILRKYAGLKVALGENPKRVHSAGRAGELTRMGIMGMLREAFLEVRTQSVSETFAHQMIKRVLDHKMPLRVHAHRADDILSAIRFAEEFDLDLRIEHCTEGHLVAKEMELLPIEKVTVGPTFTRKSKIELKNKTWETYRILHEHGLEISITTDHPYTPVQYLNLCAGLAAREGLPVDVALRAITIHPARSLGVDDRVGSIEVGKDADLVLWSHFPLDYLAKPLMTMIDGKIIFEHAQLNLT